MARLKPFEVVLAEKKKPSGAVNRRFVRLDRRISTETELRLDQCGKLHATFNGRCNDLDSRLRAVEARVRLVEDACERTDHLRVMQRLAELEHLLVELTDRVMKQSPAPFGMTKHLHPSDRKCAACEPEMKISKGPGEIPGARYLYSPVEAQSCPAFPHTHKGEGGVDIVCEVGQ
jgi:hypothetical protein